MSHTQPFGSDGQSDRSHIGLGVASIGAGLLAGTYAFGFGVGNVTEMGPGFFPLLVSVLLVGLGALVILRRGADLPPREEDAGPADRATGKSAPVEAALRSARVLGTVLGGIFVFALALKPLGLFIAVMLLTSIASLGHPGARPRSVLLLSFLLALAATLIFVVGLKLNLNALPGPF